MALLCSIKANIKVCAELFLAENKKLSVTKVEVSCMGDDHYAQSHLSLTKEELDSKDSWTVQSIVKIR